MITPTASRVGVAAAPTIHHQQPEQQHSPDDPLDDGSGTASPGGHIPGMRPSRR
jgi:hypothetical protein